MEPTTTKLVNYRGIQRLREELHQLWADPPPFCQPGESPVTDLFHWDVFHQNIHSEGGMALDILFDEWTCILTIEKILRPIVSVLYEPLLDKPVYDDVATLYKNNIKRYEEIATRCTWDFSSTPIVSHTVLRPKKSWTTARLSLLRRLSRGP
ncbi:hypothetical protein PR202_gb09597 [Eleusine coracana subsp. coracana]|uniref:UBC core domain-containing protein n=1 Tax=Eleusine coracana subsp. coracana TaxID=191504 RepID=A0AAV5EIQ5_ELECO|nr:hypothetical protein PR202_gb09597 [Eleusine coracana subsp. coracana]